ncbi:MAG: hypothetical protein AAGC88_01070 [Bacteroidota bacterium]
MTQDTFKLNLIEKLIKEEDQEVLQRLEQLMVKAQMEIHAEDSLKAVKNSETQSIDDFRRSNAEWLKKTLTE